MSKNKKIVLFSIVMFLVFVSHAMLYTQIIPFLTEVGYSVTQRGYVLSFFAAIAIIGQIGVGFLSDKTGETRKFFIFAAFIYFWAGLFAFWFDQPNFWFHFFLISFMAAMTRIIANIYEIWTLEVEGLYHDFGKIRTFGSLGWAVASLFSGYVVTHYGFRPLGFIAGGLSLIIIFLSFRLEDAHKIKNEQFSFNDVKLLFKNKNYVLLLVVYTVAYLAFNAEGITVVDLIYSLGGNAQNVGTKWFIHALFEMPTMFIMGALLLKYRGKKLMIFAAAVAGVRYILYGFVGDISQIYWLTTLQMFTFPIILVTQKDLIFHEVPAFLSSSAQMIATSICTGLSSILTPLIASQLIASTSIQTAFFVFAAMMFLSIVIILFYKPQLTKHS
ncbi:MFS transporter [Erysipelothrix sp. HDW6C]|uniref:MFS transporter n=1 Tax=Erysipelothrix sp. HDW6C TaxID=2714930 RepID=UPI00140DBF1C|nr:MFS transporter [Erysipelothrix sp. HDW6C]QIK70424.1 MFS transporter [Erysipelothrix sp. HDW6C]